MLRSLVIIAGAFNTNRMAFGRCLHLICTLARGVVVVGSADTAILSQYRRVDGWKIQDQSSTLWASIFTRTAEGEECIARKDLWQRFSARRNNGTIKPLESVPSMNGFASGSIHSPSSTACGGPEGCVTVKNNPILINRKNKLAADSTMLHRRRRGRRRRPKLWLGKVVLERFTVARFNTDSGVGGLE